MEDLKHLKRLVIELNQSNSSNKKKEVLKRYPQCRKILKYIYNPFKQYYVTSANLEKKSDLIAEDVYPDLYTLLDDLNDRKITGHAAIAAVNAYIKSLPAYAELILRIIDRNLKTRTDAKLINKVWPGLIPSFNVALAQKFDDYADKINFNKENWFASRKLDGVRVITIIDENGDITFWSRKGKEFTTLSNVKKAFSNCNLKNVVFDGEMCIVDKDGNEDFNSIVKLMRRKDFTIKNPKYKIFDFLTLDEFNNQTSTRILSTRINLLKTTVNNDPILEVVEQWKIESHEHLAELTEEASNNGWEGLIIRKDVPYEGKRTKNMLKVKKFYDAEYVIKNVVMGPIRWIDNGKERQDEMVSAIEIQHKGYPVSVGSGFSIEQRQYYYQHPEELIGKTVTVVYFEETTNKQGTISLRFPTVKHIYENGRDM